MPVLQGNIQVVNLSTGVLRLIVEYPPTWFTNYDITKHTCTINLKDDSFNSQWITLDVAGQTSFSFLCGQVVNAVPLGCQGLFTQLYNYLFNILTVKEDGIVIGTQPTLNFIEGDSVEIDIVNDTVNQELDITISSDETPKMLMLMGG